MYAGPGGDRKTGKAWGWPAYALQQACAGVLGIVIVDLVFDFQEPEVARAYYAVMRAPRVVSKPKENANRAARRIPSLVTSVLVPLLIVVMAVGVYRRWYVGVRDLFLNRDTVPFNFRPFYLVVDFVFAAPYLIWYLQPAELRVAAAAPGSDLADDLDQIKRGHYVLSFVLISALACINTEPKPWRPTYAYEVFDAEYYCQQVVKKKKLQDEAEQAAADAKAHLENLAKGDKAD